jgi:aryl-phospho-beta-D-glucosidase BglC (GH1 family)/lysophospholipase L1-like esterase
MRGVNIADPDKLFIQERWNRRLFEEIADWGANTIRLPVHPMGWRKRGPDWYLERIDEAVFWANSLGLYLIMDWHSIGNLKTQMFQHPMYQTSMAETRDFWRRIAFRYRDVPTVAVYELFNEPTDNFIGNGAGSLGPLDWESWRETLEELVDIVQVYDPVSISLVGGMNWAYNLEPVAQMPVRRDGIAYASHAYPQKANPDENTRQAFHDAWQKNWGFVAETYPVIATEIGWVREDGYNAHVPVIDNDGTYGPNLVRFMEERGISWTVWNFDVDWSPTMISDWDFTPTEQGAFFRDVMLRAKNGTLRNSVLPSPRVTEYEWMSIARWNEMLSADITMQEKEDVQLLLVGDSITEMWPQEILEANFAEYRPANFGIGGDQTQNLLWRLRQGSADGIQPDGVVLMIGVNNLFLGGDKPEDVFYGVEAVLDELQQRFGDAGILLLGLLPVGEEAGAESRAAVAGTNQLLASLGERKGVTYADIGAAFLEQDGSISSEIMPDFLHPSEKGYAVFAEQLKPLLAKILD